MIVHKTIETRLHNANFYLDQLLKTYELSNEEFGFEYSFLRRTFTENIITNLCSALDALAHEIKIIYNIDIKDRSISFSHGHSIEDKKNNDCLRCRLRNADEDLSNILDQILLFQNNPSENWYDALFEYRHQILHRTHFIFMVTIGNILYLPDNPKSESNEKPRFDKVKKKPIIPNYTIEREIRKFSIQSIRIVLVIIESIYQYIITNKIREKFFFYYDSKLKNNRS